MEVRTAGLLGMSKMWISAPFSQGTRSLFVSSDVLRGISLVKLIR